MACAQTKPLYEILITKKESHELKGLISMNIFIVYKSFHNFTKMFEEGSVVTILAHLTI